jgi:hypothetical protein
MAHAPETIWLVAEDDLTFEWHLTIESAKTWGTPVEYTRADLFRAQLQQMRTTRLILRRRASFALRCSPPCSTEHAIGSMLLQMPI